MRDMHRAVSRVLAGGQEDKGVVVVVVRVWSEGADILCVCSVAVLNTRAALSHRQCALLNS